MKILFLAPFARPTATYYAGINLGLAQLAAVASDAGAEAEVRNFWDAAQLDEFAGRRFDYVFIGTYTHQLKLVRQTVNIMNAMGLKVVLGGLHATFAPEDFADSPYYLLVRGEGEVFTRQLISDPSRAETMTGVWHPGVPGKGFAPMEQNLDVLPDPFRYLAVTDKVRNIMGFELLSSRGCFYKCAYCSAPALSGIYPGYYRR
ncbi:MAG: cobalamin-dependent protein, partial [Candidatus Wallbacteria bacterium]|nr:cobalamin-dependent protein [Candidatus Wallbacteria bacterium]